MDSENNAAGAAGGDPTPALSLDDAVATLNEGDEQREKDDAAPGAAEDEPKPNAEAHEPADEVEPSDEDESPSEPDEGEGEPEDETDDNPEIVPGNKLTRMEDGSVKPIGELKKAYARLQEIERQGPEISAQRAEIDKTKADVQQRQKLLEEVLPLVQHLAQKAVPPNIADDDPLWDADPIEAMNQRRRHDAAVREVQRIDGAQKAFLAEQQKAQAEEFQNVVKEQEAKLLQLRPELKDPAKRDAFDAALIAAAKTMGFSKEEAEAPLDHRLKANLVPLYEDALKWRKLQASKPKAMEKAKDAAPVQQPGRRAAPGERRGTETEALSKRLSQTGSIDDAAALLDKLNL